MPHRSNMTTTHSIASTARDAAILQQPFVGHNKPLVGDGALYSLPFVGYKQPSVIYWQNYSKKSVLSAPRHSERGFSMIELMITLVIFVLVAGFAVPAFMRMIENNRITTQANSFIADLKFARSEAIKRGTKVSICVANAAGDDCDAAGDWKTRQRIIWNDTNIDGVIDAGETVLRVREPLGGNRTSFGDPLGVVTAIGFDAKGMTDLGAAGAGAATLAICYDNDNDGTPDTETGRDILIGFTGISKVVRPATACP